MKFTHVHVHSHYSILDGMSKVPDLVDKCMRNGMRSMALTDHGSMFGIKEFVDYSNKVNKKIQEKIGELEAEPLFGASFQTCAFYLVSFITDSYIVGNITNPI